MSEQSPPGALFGLGKDDRRLLERIEKRVEELQRKLLRAIDDHTAKAVERHRRTMATIQDLRDALAEQNAAIVAEIEEINQALAAAGNIPADVVAEVRSHTDRVKGIINTPLPEPAPEPTPPAPPERRR